MLGGGFLSGSVLLLWFIVVLHFLKIVVFHLFFMVLISDRCCSSKYQPKIEEFFPGTCVLRSTEEHLVRERNNLIGEGYFDVEK